MKVHLVTQFDLTEDLNSKPSQEEQNMPTNSRDLKAKTKNRKRMKLNQRKDAKFMKATSQPHYVRDIFHHEKIYFSSNLAPHSLLTGVALLSGK